MAQTASKAEPAPTAAMTIDVEDWFHVENLKPAIPRDSWQHRELRVERNTERMLELLGEHDARCTCFVLGWVAERCPSLVQRIAAAGHEIACHGYGHELVYELSEHEFREDVRRCKELLEDLTGGRVHGYRAPNFSITDWSISTLQELGFAYDSSVFPTVAHDRYGTLAGVTAGTPIVELRPGFHEVCVSCLVLGPVALPWGGGGYFRLTPYGVFRHGITRILCSGQPYVFYIHPWELDPGQPRVTDLSRLRRLRHYVGLRHGEARFRSLLQDFRWGAVTDVLAGSSRPSRVSPVRS
jgi:polysaccharide deacetylase family protein (PEP-CTERM system associated)